VTVSRDAESSERSALAMTFLSDDLKNRILDLLPRYPNKQAVTLPALHIVQDHHRCVPLGAIRDIADLLDLSPAEVADTMTFYGFFRNEDDPLGRTRLWVCRSLACQLRGCDDLIAHLCDSLGVKPGGTTADKAITLETAECIGACEGAPAVLVNDEHVMDVTNAKADELVGKLRK
jgi:NADH-quinone oxidoreductase subunit E